MTISYTTNGAKWQQPIITWSIAAFNYTVDAGRIVFSHAITGTYVSLVQQAINEWSAVSGLVFHQVADSSAVDIRIGFATLNTVATGTIGDTSWVSNGGFLRPDVLVSLEDPSQLPIVNGTYQGYQTQFYQDVLHEVGHALGLGHSADPSAVMYPTLTTADRDLDASDIAGIHAIYSAAPAPPPPPPPPPAPVATNPDFDAAFYLAHNPDVARAGIDPLTHFLNWGWKEGRDPNAFFSIRYYLYQNPDVAAAGVDPLLHYEQYGWHEGYRDPSLAFSTSKYLQANPDVASAGMDPLSHYLRYGQAEHRMAFISAPHGTGQQDPLVDNAYYFSQNQDVAAVGMNPFTHYDAYGWHEGRNPDALFDTAYYLQQNPDVRAVGIDPMLHYEIYGGKEGRNPSAQFSTAKYLAANPDVAAAGMNALVHYEEYGIHEGRAIFSV